MAVARVAAQTRDDACVLESLVGVIEHRAADGRAAGVGTRTQQLGEPAAVPHLHVVVQQQQVLARRGFPAEVVDGREVEALFRPRHHLQPVVPLLCLLVIGKGGRVGGVVLDDDDLEVVPLSLGPDAVQTLLEVVDVVLAGDEDADLGVALDVPLHPVGAGENAVLHPAGAPGAGQMIGQRLFRCRRHIGLCLGAAGGRTGVDPPVVEHLRDMGRAAGLLDEAEEEVVVLTAVAGRPLAAQLLVQRPPEDRQMADIITAEQIIRGIIGL